MHIAQEIVQEFSQFMWVAATTRRGSFRHWPNRALLLDEPLALAEERTSRLRRIYEKCADTLWDGPTVFREAVAKHGGIQLDEHKRRALAYPISMVMWGELAAWIVSAELTERLEDPDARMAASSQVFDEARHFYTMRDYLALLHVPVPALDPYFGAALRALLDSRDLTLKLLAMQILVEGLAQAIFRFLGDSQIEPVLSEILPYIERDEARHVGLGVLHLPPRLAALTPAQQRSLARRVTSIGGLLGVAQLRIIEQWRTIGIDPRDLFKHADQLLFHLAGKLGTLPDGGFYFRADDPRRPEYAHKLDLLAPLPGSEHTAQQRWVRRLVSAGACLLAV